VPGWAGRQGGQHQIGQDAKVSKLITKHSRGQQSLVMDSGLVTDNRGNAQRARRPRDVGQDSDVKEDNVRWGIVCGLDTDHRGKARWARSQAKDPRDVPKYSQKREERVSPWSFYTQRPTEDANLQGMQRICKESRRYIGRGVKVSEPVNQPATSSKLNQRP
jgi:hypothetical protein